MFKSGLSGILLFSFFGTFAMTDPPSNEALDLVPEEPSVHFAWPVKGIPSQTYGNGIHPGSGYRHLQATVDEKGEEDGGHHIGVDFNTAEGDEDLGDPIYLIADAISVYVGRGYGRGLGDVAIFAFQLESGEILYARYAHMGKIYAVPGESYPAGRIIGRMGNTGMERGGFAHLHLDIATRLTFEERFVGEFANLRWYPRMSVKWYINRHFIDPVAFLEEYAVQEGPARTAPEPREDADPPLRDLPVFWVWNAPALITPLTRSGQPIDPTLPENAEFVPEWVQLSNMPLDVLPPIRPEPGLEVPREFHPLGSVPWVADVPHLTGLQPTLMKVVVGYGEIGTPPYYWNGTLMGKSGIVSTYAFTDQIRIYPSKIYNILTALAAISEWQEEHGPLMPGEIYSYLEMTGVTDRNADQFLVGGYLEAGGICASVTTISKTIFIAESLGYTEVAMRFLHAPNIQYAENPLDPAITKRNSDATVGFIPGRPADWEANGDYRFRIAEDSPPLYLSFAAEVVPGDAPIGAEYPARHRTQPADARIVFTVTLTTWEPNFDREQERLLELREIYAQFHGFDDEFLGGFNN